MASLIYLCSGACTQFFIVIIDFFIMFDSYLKKIKIIIYLVMIYFITK
jgi:hypothetical protein